MIGRSLSHINTVNKSSDSNILKLVDSNLTWDEYGDIIKFPDFDNGTPIIEYKIVKLRIFSNIKIL